MTWLWVLLACLACFLTKLVGFLVPRRFLDDHRTSVTMAGMTVGVLAGLVALSTFVVERRLVIDARLAALLVAVVALRLRAPFLLVVVLGAAAAAGVRLLGIGV